MKTLLLMRHAKSSWKDNSIKDIDRPLNKRGRRDAPRMGDLLKEVELVPQVILCSPALRTRLTAEAVARASGFSGEIQYYDAYYMGEPEDYLKKLVKLPDEVERVMVIGHNPGLEMLMQMLSEQVEALSTASIAYLSLPIDHWKDLKPDVEAQLNEIWRPKALEPRK